MVMGQGEWGLCTLWGVGMELGRERLMLVGAPGGFAAVWRGDRQMPPASLTLFLPAQFCHEAAVTISSDFLKVFVEVLVGHGHKAL